MLDEFYCDFLYLENTFKNSWKFFQERVPCMLNTFITCLNTIQLDVLHSDKRQSIWKMKEEIDNPLRHLLIIVLNISSLDGLVEPKSDP